MTAPRRGEVEAVPTVHDFGNGLLFVAVTDHITIRQAWLDKRGAVRSHRVRLSFEQARTFNEFSKRLLRKAALKAAELK